MQSSAQTEVDLADTLTYATEKLNFDSFKSEPMQCTQNFAAFPQKWLGSGKVGAASRSEKGRGKSLGGCEREAGVQQAKEKEAKCGNSADFLLIYGF